MIFSRSKMTDDFTRIGGRMEGRSQSKFLWSGLEILMLDQSDLDPADLDPADSLDLPRTANHTRPALRYAR